jgi:hypothetical protein
MNISYDIDLFNNIKSEYVKELIIIEEPNSIQHLTGPKKRGINRDSRLKGECITDNCSNIFEYKFRDIVNKGRLCRQCRIKNGNKERKETISAKYSSCITNIMQLESTKKKAKETYKKNTGYEHPSQNPEIQNKIINTCIKNWGVRHISMSNNIKQQKRKNLLNNSKLKYTNKFLDKLLIKDKATLEEKIDDIHLTRNKNIKYKCNCGILDEKIFRMIEKYGAYCDACQLIYSKTKTIKTNIERRGVSYVAQDPNVIKKAQSTSIKRYGVRSPTQLPEIQKKIRSTCFTKYGFSYPQQNPEIRNKTIKTVIERYGVNYPIQNADIAEKASHNAYKIKIYSFPSGKEVRVQGYENYALDILINIEKINEEDIIVSRKLVPEIWYKDKNSHDHRYYMDIFIKSKNRCIEVKSTRTYELNIDKVKYTKIAVQNSNILYECWIMNNKGEILFKHL